MARHKKILMAPPHPKDVIFMCINIKLLLSPVIHEPWFEMDQIKFGGLFSGESKA